MSLACRLRGTTRRDIGGTTKMSMRVAGHRIGHRNNPAHNDAGWSSLVAREAHNLEVVGSNPAPATSEKPRFIASAFLFFKLCFLPPLAATR